MRHSNMDNIFLI